MIVRCSERADGDFHLERVDGPTLDLRRRAFVDLPWSQVQQVHGAEVAVIGEAGGELGMPVDALVTALPDTVLGIWTADCAPVALDGGDVIGAAHAGWRGLLADVIAATVDAMRQIGGTPTAAVLGPCIHPCCYEFGADDLGAMERRFGASVRSTTAWGAPALDVPAAVRSALDEHGIVLDDRSECTGCRGDRFFSHRVRAEPERQVMAVWRPTDRRRGAA